MERLLDRIMSMEIICATSSLGMGDIGFQERAGQWLLGRKNLFMRDSLDDLAISEDS